MGTAYEHFVGTNKMYAAQEQFRHVTKMVCDFVKSNKIGALRLKFEKKCKFAVLIWQNAYLSATPDSCRSPSGSVLPVAAARIVLPPALQELDRQQMTAAIKSAPLGRVDRKIALLRYVERLPLPDIAAQTHYSRTAIGYRLKGIEKMLDV